MDLMEKRRLQAAKIAIASREREERAGHCRCSDMDGNLLRHQPGGCPLHPAQVIYYASNITEIDSDDERTDET